MQNESQPLLGCEDARKSAGARPELNCISTHEAGQLPGPHQGAGIALGFGKDGLRVLDGVVDQSRVAVVAAQDVQPWMSGISWDLVPAPGGSWYVLNQGLSAAALTRMGEAVMLCDVTFGWPRPEQIWRLFRCKEGHACMLRNQGGGWLSLAEEGPVLLPRQFDTPDKSLFWNVLDAVAMLHTSSLAGGVAS